MATPDTVFKFLEEAIKEQMFYNIEMWGYFKNTQEAREVIDEEIDEVINAFKDFKKSKVLLQFNMNNLPKIKDLSIHLIEECIHVIAAIDKLNEKEMEEF